MKRRYKLDAPKGVNSRNRQNTLIKKTIGWESDLPLRRDMKTTYALILGKMTGRKKRANVTTRPAQSLLAKSNVKRYFPEAEEFVLGGAIRPIIGGYCGAFVFGSGGIMPPIIGAATSPTIAT